MTRTILCPVDFSAASRTAVQYAAALARHFGSGLVILTVNDALLAEAAAMQSSARLLSSWVSKVTQLPNDSTLTCSPVLPRRRYSMLGFTVGVAM